VGNLVDQHWQFPQGNNNGWPAGELPQGNNSWDAWLAPHADGGQTEQGPAQTQDQQSEVYADYVAVCSLFGVVPMLYFNILYLKIVIGDIDRHLFLLRTDLTAPPPTPGPVDLLEPPRAVPKFFAMVVLRGETGD
jgi:hypothetical protein